ncbi:MAG: ABC transporter substrate-binding protein [Rhodospirillaceae bacterium]|nr:ABC transporter substrate-binding protein [Rhodospirillaceae bacterium]MBT7265998.1 ABC transporter substrate-binding protein [Rhodospirillaceae bacterium]
MIGLIALALPCQLAAQEMPKPVHGIAMHGSPKYGPDFKHFDYVNPTAAKGGAVRLSAIGTFDTFNPYTIKGIPAAGIGGFVYETLMVGSQDEAFTEYGKLAESVEMPKDRSWVAFTLRKEARWQDGKPVTVEDVIFSLNALKTKGQPFYRFYYRGVTKAEKAGERRVKFTFGGGKNRELPLIVGQLPILPKHAWAGKDFSKTTLDKPIGSGPYKVKSFEAGRSITLERDKNYWGAKLPVEIGQHNFDEIRFDYYRDSTVALEAFKSGEYDFRQENTSKIWATGYDSPAFKKGLYKKQTVRHENPTGMQGFVFNTRKDFFKNPVLRKALAYAFDFEWTNKNLFYGQYSRTTSFFSNSELASRGLPSAEELKILSPFKGKIPPEVFTQTYLPPGTDGTGRIRKNLRQAKKLLQQTGWQIKNKLLVNAKTGKQLKFEVLLISPAFERIVLPFVRNLKRLGIIASVRTVDTAQYRKRLDTYDFDMIVGSFGQSLSPGNEQMSFWGSAAADRTGGRNWIGIKDPVIDKLIDLVIQAPDREALITRTRALDRVLLWNHFIIPQWHIQSFRVAFWDKFGRPAKTPKYGLGFDSWWVDTGKAKALASKLTSTKK